LDTSIQKSSFPKDQAIEKINFFFTARHFFLVLILTSYNCSLTLHRFIIFTSLALNLVIMSNAPAATPASSLPTKKIQKLQEAPLVSAYEFTTNNWDKSRKYPVIDKIDQAAADQIKGYTGKTRQELDLQIKNELRKQDDRIAPIIGPHVDRVERIVNSNYDVIAGVVKQTSLLSYISASPAEVEVMLDEENENEEVADIADISSPTTAKKRRSKRKSALKAIKKVITAISPISKKISKRPAGTPPPPLADLIVQAKSVFEEYPTNLCAKYLIQYLESSPTIFVEEKHAYHNFYNCVRTGLENKDSGLGCYAMSPSDYETYAGFFDAVIGDYHCNDPKSPAIHETDWDLKENEYDIAKLCGEVSMRVRVGRNLTAYNLPGAMNKAERIRFERNAVLPALNALIADPELGGAIYSLSPDLGEGVVNPNLISAERYDELIKEHVMFKDMDADPYLKSAGISSDWPYGRGCWQSTDKQSIIWFGEEDQFRIMCMFKGTKLSGPFEKLNKLLTTCETQDGVEFAKSTRYGAVTSCPSNLGTGMRASVHVKVPKLTKDGTDKAKEIAKEYGLSVRGTGGEHTPIGADGTIDLSPSSRLFIKESEIVAKLYDGIEKLMEAEKKAAGWFF
jgi:arginine kinase